MTWQAVCSTRLLKSSSSHFMRVRSTSIRIPRASRKRQRKSTSTATNSTSIKAASRSQPLSVTMCRPACSSSQSVQRFIQVCMPVGVAKSAPEETGLRERRLRPAGLTAAAETKRATRPDRSASSYRSSTTLTFATLPPSGGASFETRQRTATSCGKAA